MLNSGLWGKKKNESFRSVKTGKGTKGHFVVSKWHQIEVNLERTYRENCKKNILNILDM